MMRYTTAALWLVLASCGGASEAPMDAMPSERARGQAAEPEAMEEAWEGERDAIIAIGGGEAGMPRLGDGLMRPAPAAPPPPPPLAASPMDGVSADDVRRWFPETFLWQPLVLTDDDGVAEVEVEVPDQLTTWRVLGLAHDRRGEQAGTVHTFDSALDVYVDPVTPAWLYSGDVLKLPVQVSNVSDAPFTEPLLLTTEGPVSGSGAGTVSVPAGATVMRTLELTAQGAGEALVRTDFGRLDAAERRIGVQPTGRPVVQQTGGVVSASREIRSLAPDGTDPSTDVLDVDVFPGPLAVLQAEIERLPGLSREPATAAVGYALAHRMADLGEAVGQPIDEAVLRRMRLTAHQRVVRAATTRSTLERSLLVYAMRDLAEDSPSAGIRQRLIEGIVDMQRGDGTWAWRAGGDVQELVVQTAWMMAVLPSDEEAALQRASGAMERFAPEVDDPYTAAVLVGTGAVGGELRDALMEVVREGLVQGDGVTTVRVPSRANSPVASRPSHAEMLAWTVLAFIADDDPEMAGVLTGELMGDYDAVRGFGAGAADLVALDAVLAAVTPLDQPVTVRAVFGGATLAEARLDPSQPLRAASLEVPLGASSEAVTLQIDPPVAGLSFVAARRSWVPWSEADKVPGLDVELTQPDWQVGVEAPLGVALAGVSGQRYSVEIGLPAGATVDEAALEGLRSQVSDVMVHTDRVVVVTERFDPAEVLELSLPVRPAFAGRFHTAPVRVSDPDRPWQASVLLPPARWTVR